MKGFLKAYGQFIYAACSAVLFFVALAYLNWYGVAQRAYGSAVTLGSPALHMMTVQRPEEAYGIWKEKGYRGRVLVAVGRRLSFLYPSMEALAPYDFFPIQPYPISETAEKKLDNTNFLYVAMETGIARKLYHVVPESVFDEKYAYVTYGRQEEGVTLREGEISVPFSGSPRVIQSLPFFRNPEEAVLLYVNASIFKDYVPEYVFSVLKDSGLTTDSVVLCTSLDDPEVTVREREALGTFASLLGAGNEHR